MPKKELADLADLTEVVFKVFPEYRQKLYILNLAKDKYTGLLQDISLAESSVFRMADRIIELKGNLYIRDEEGKKVLEQDIAGYISEFDKAYKPIKAAHIEPELEPETQMPATIRPQQAIPPESSIEEPSVPDTAVDTPASETIPSPASFLEAPEPRVEPLEEEEKIEPSPVTLRSRTSQMMKNLLIKLNHTKFVDELNKAAVHNDPYLMAAMILKYSDQIDDVDPDSSLRLLAIAEGIVGE